MADDDPVVDTNNSNTSNNEPPRTSPTSYAFSASTLRERHVPLRESLPTASSITNSEGLRRRHKEPEEATKESNKNPTATTVTPADSEEDGSPWECNICLDMASDPVVTLCGHLFCWPCIHQWMLSRLPASNACPVCKSALDSDRVIPIFVRGREAKDPRKAGQQSASASGSRSGESSIPGRPQPQRAEPQPARRTWANAFSGIFNNNMNVHHQVPMEFGGGNVQFGIGMFPFGFTFVLGTANNNIPNAAGANAVPESVQQQAFVSRLFLMVGTIVLLFILLY